MSKTKKNKTDYSEYILPVVGPLIGLALTSLFILPFNPMTPLEYIIFLGKAYLDVVGFVLVVLLATALVMLLMRIPVIDQILFSKKAKEIYR